jgi:hypothetical protein
MATGGNEVRIRILAELGDLRGQLQGVKTDVQSFTGAARSAFSGLNADFAKFGLAVQGVREAINMISAPFVSVSRTAAEFESLQARLESLYGSAREGAEVFAVLADVAATTPFSLQDVVRAGVTMKAFGIEAKSTAKAVADLAAFMGEDATMAAASLGRAFSGGVAAADILRERGVLAIVRSFSGIEDLTKITLPEFRKALIEAMSDPAAGIAGSTDRLSKTFGGAVSNMKDAVDQLKAAIGTDLNDALKGAVLGITDMANATRENLAQISASVKAVTGLLAGAAVASGLSLLPQAIGAVVAALASLRAAWVAVFIAQTAVNPWALAAGLAAAAAATVYFYGSFKTGAENAADAAKRLRDESGGAAESLSALGDSMTRLRDAGLVDTASEMKTMIARIEELKRFKSVDLGMLFAPADAKSYTPDPDQIRLSQRQLIKLQEQLQRSLADVDTKGAAERAKEAARAAKELARAVEDAAIRDFDQQQQWEEDNLARATSNAQKLEDALASIRRVGIERQGRLIDDQIAADMARWQRQVETLSGFMSTVATGLGDSFQGVFQSGMEGLREGLKGMLLTIVAAIEQLVMAARIKALAEAIVMAKFNPALTLASLASKMPSIIGLEAMFAVLRSGITKFETGGVIDRPTLALMGEATQRSGREIVAPERSFKQWATDTLVPLVQGVGGAPDTRTHQLLEGLDGRLAKLERSLPRGIGRELALASRGRL